MKKIVAFGASSSKKSINKQFASYAASLISDADSIIIDLNDFEMPIYSIDYENDKGIPEKAFKFKEIIKSADGIIISFAEHNSVYTAAFKNIFDWISRIEKLFGTTNRCYYFQHLMVVEELKRSLKLHIKEFQEETHIVFLHFHYQTLMIILKLIKG